jgi:hypothetical protein
MALGSPVCGRVDPDCQGEKLARPQQLGAASLAARVREVLGCVGNDAP